MTVVTVNRFGDLAVAMHGSSREGAHAAGELYAEAMRARLSAGYTTGDFVTGHVAESVQVTDPYASESSPYADGDEGDAGVSVGTDVLYAAFWEDGHNNIFTRRWEQVETWGPILQEMTPRMIDVYADTVVAGAERVSI